MPVLGTRTALHPPTSPGAAADARPTFRLIGGIKVHFSYTVQAKLSRAAMPSDADSPFKRRLPLLCTAKTPVALAEYARLLQAAERIVKTLSILQLR